jgi:hypothetical protein
MKTTLIMTMSLTMLLACGQEGAPGPQGEPGPQGQAGVSGTNCSVSQNEQGALIECEDGTLAQINHGSDGMDGSDGADGSDGIDGIDGVDGIDGIDGVDGETPEINSDLVYRGSHCGRVVVSVGDKFYLVRFGLVPLTERWYRIYRTCKVRVVDGEVESR